MALVVLPALAEAEEFRGESAQGWRVELRTGPDDEMRRFSIRWKTNSCSAPYHLNLTQTTSVPPLDRSKPGFFVDRGQYRVRYQDGRVRYKVGARGRQDSDGWWRGTFRAKAFLDLDNGDEFTCKLRRIKWFAKPRP